MVSMRHTQFRWLYASNALFFFAMNGQFVVRSYLAYKLTDDSPFALGLINLAVALPMLLMSPIGGVVSDRIERRKLVVIGQGLIVANELTVLLLLMTNTLEFWHLLVMVAFMGCIFPFIMPARQAMTVEIVGRRELSNAMALMMGAMNAARVVAPALAGFVIYLVRIEWTYAIAVSVYAAALFCMFKVNRSQPVREEKKSVYHDMLEGARYVAKTPSVRALMILSIVPMLLAMPFQSLLVVFAEDVWDTGSRGLGILQAAAGLGGVAGSVYVAWHGESKRLLRVMVGSLVGFAATLLLFALSPYFLLALPLLLISDAFASIFGTVNGTAIQLLIPDHVRGRVMSLMMMTFGLTPLGALPVSAAAEAWGAPVAVGGAAVVTVLLSLLLVVLSRSLREIDSTAREARAAELAGPSQFMPLTRPGAPAAPVQAASAQ
ncbi:hypothetical protein AYO38_06745 [bacterium SCGC AG-212-C10]|nr:hypothetical protein AYO38_06745 [bacterium SCGC AG-212-C10]